MQAQRRGWTQAKQLGEYIKLCSWREGQPFLVLGPNKFCFIFSFLAFNLVSAVMLILLTKNPQAYLFYIVHLVILIYFDVAWLAAALTNPGIIKKGCRLQLACQFCKVDNPHDHGQVTIQQHCKICKVCIEGRAYHCGIIGGCLGDGNHISYYFWLLGLVLWSIDFITTAPYLYYLQ